MAAGVVLVAAGALETGAAAVAAGAVAGVSVPADGLALAAPASDSVFVAAALSPAAGASVLPPRKSVTYQPVPLSWKPAAVTCF